MPGRKRPFGIAIRGAVLLRDACDVGPIVVAPYYVGVFRHVAIAEISGLLRPGKSSWPAWLFLGYGLSITALGSAMYRGATVIGEESTASQLLRVADPHPATSRLA